MTGQDPSAFQAWLIAIPSAITALSTWYINRKTVKTSQQSSTENRQMVSDKAFELSKDIKELQDRMSRVEECIGKTRDSQILIAQKHSETMSLVTEEVRKMKTSLSSLLPEKSESASLPKSQPLPPPTKDGGKVVVVDETPQPLGKVIRKP